MDCGINSERQLAMADCMLPKHKLLVGDTRPTKARMSATMSGIFATNRGAVWQFFKICQCCDANFKLSNIPKY